MFGFDQSAKVYTPNGTDGAYTVLATTLAECRLAISSAGARGGERESSTAQPRLLWLGTYAMPDPAQIEVNGDRYNVVEGTYAAIRGPNGLTHHRHCDVVAV
jgi:hypothetical protein